MTDPIGVDLCETRALPILRYIAEHEAEQQFISIGQLAEATRIEPNLVTVEVERLVDAGYIPGQLVKMGTGGDSRPWFLDQPRLTECGARAVSVGPKAEHLLRVLEARAEAEPDPARKKTLMTLVGTVKVHLKLLDARRDQDRGKVLGSSRLTVEKFLRRWLDDIARQRVRPQTFDRYRELVTVHLIPAAGRIPLDKLGPAEVQAILNAKAAAGLSPRTVHHIRAVLRNALNQALRWGLVLRNVAELVDPPRVPETQQRTLSIAEAGHVLHAIKGDRLEAAYVVGLSLGLRIGEVLGLRSDSIDLERGVLTVQASLQRVDGRLMLREPKTARRRRTLPLTSIALAALRSHRDRQLHEKVQPGPPWSGLVFGSPAGRPLDGSKVVQALHRVLVGAGLPPIRFHVLRHSCASLLFAQGVPAKTVQEILGHSRIGTTLDIYTHVASDDQPVPSVLREAADAMDRALVPPSLAQFTSR